MNKLSPTVKDRLILIGWFVGLLLSASLVWSLSFNYRARFLMRSVNIALYAAGDSRKLVSHLPGRFTKPAVAEASAVPAYAGPMPMGLLYSLNESDSLFYIFAFMNEGILVPCGVEINKDGKAVDIVPLGSHARQVIGRVPQGVIQVYLRRIESAMTIPPRPQGEGVE